MGCLTSYALTSLSDRKGYQGGAMTERRETCESGHCLASPETKRIDQANALEVADIR
jgi:hypothetical protein